MTILLLGAGGQVGHELSRCLAPLGSVTAVARTGGERTADLSRPDAVDALLAEVRPELIVNAAAYTAVDRAEDEPDACRRVNRELPARLAAYAASAGAALVHYSTDYAFDGTASHPYDEDAPTAPIGVYGRSKLEGEEAIRAAGCAHLILRSAWIYSTHGRNFLKTILALARERPALRIVDDQFGTPTWARSLAQLTAAALLRLPARGGWGELAGTYHVSAVGPPTSWYGFAETFLAWARERDPGAPLARLEPVGTDAYPTRARRPRYSVLDNRRFEARFGLQVPDWRRQLRWCLEDFVPLPGADGPARDVRSTAVGSR